MTVKSERLRARWGRSGTVDADRCYRAYFDCFNQGFHYEAHDVLELLWLPERQGPDGDFYKGLIQLAGAFVHVRKDRRLPALALLNLAAGNLRRYPSRHRGLDLGPVLDLIRAWAERLQTAQSPSRLLEGAGGPRLAGPA